MRLRLKSVPKWTKKLGEQDTGQGGVNWRSILWAKRLSLVAVGKCLHVTLKDDGTTKHTNHTKNEVLFVYFVYFVV